ncbi:alpha/beta hydrolase [Chamaesiphon sp. OTE_75_metabat_556]|uniref:alpha/beta fold hydrolase n=1 Tax=Chamaesiphon sp. OTE_75_metabat_556 TaxID=2964692 RepID=UPI00286A9EFF|nr:alpha/beta hydrolase [Chamaesiphon sp. OTE_75_metabat_556]
MIIDRPKFIWINASPSLKCFHRRLLHQLSKAVEIEFWEYYQTLDEGSSIEGAIHLLAQYLSCSDRPIDLIGHGIGGVIALGYARLYPERVASLTLLSVAVQPAIDWHSYYYTQLRSSPSSRECVLRSIASNLFPSTCANHIYSLTERLERDLVEAPSNHSLFRLDILAAGGVKMPLMICASQDDPVISLTTLSGWHSYLKSTDTIYRVTTGSHFFHHFYPELVSCQIQQFWQKLSPSSGLYQLASVEFN